MDCAAGELFISGFDLWRPLSRHAVFGNRLACIYRRAHAEPVSVRDDSGNRRFDTGIDTRSTRACRHVGRQRSGVRSYRRRQAQRLRRADRHHRDARRFADHERVGFRRCGRRLCNLRRARRQAAARTARRAGPLSAPAGIGPAFRRIGTGRTLLGLRARRVEWNTNRADFRRCSPYASSYRERAEIFCLA